MSVGWSRDHSAGEEKRENAFSPKSGDDTLPALITLDERYTGKVQPTQLPNKISLKQWPKETQKSRNVLSF